MDISENGYYFGGYFQGSLFLILVQLQVITPTTMMPLFIKLILMAMANGFEEYRGQYTENFKSLTTDEFDNVYILGNYNSPIIYY